jgi:hypothetical protein
MWFSAYWELFAHQTFEADGLVWLQNSNLPILEVNAGYGSNLSLLEQHCQTLERPCLLVSATLPSNAEVQHRLTLLEWRGTANNVYIEQVPWTRASLLAQAWCEQHHAQPWQALVALELARVLQKTPDLCAYLALESDKPIGMLLAMPKNGWWHDGTPPNWFSPQPQGAACGWWAGERQTAEALFARASADFGGLEVAVPAAWGLVGQDVCISHVSDVHAAQT